MFMYYNPSPCHKDVGDCVIRAISKAMNYGWERTYIELAIQGFMMCDMPSANHVWGMYLKEKGFKRHLIHDDYVGDYTVGDFCKDHPEGVYVLALSSHVVTVVDGDIYDTWDSSYEIPLYYFERV